MTERNQFLKLSKALTGFAIKALDDKNYPITITPQSQLPADYYLALAKQRMGADFVTKQLLKPLPDKVKRAAQNDDTQQGQAARELIRLWYTGTWTQPFDYQGYKKGDQEVVNTLGYKRGLMWLAGQTHAMGYSEMQFGYWNAPPTQSLSQLKSGSK